MNEAHNGGSAIGLAEAQQGAAAVKPNRKELAWIRRVVQGQSYIEALGSRPRTLIRREALAISYLESPRVRARLVLALMLADQVEKALRVQAWGAISLLGQAMERGAASTGEQRQAATAMRVLDSVRAMKGDPSRPRSLPIPSEVPNWPPRHRLPVDDEEEPDDVT